VGVSSFADEYVANGHRRILLLCRTAKYRKKSPICSWFVLNSDRLLALAARGDGHPVLVLPSFMGNDTSTMVIRTFLRMAGFRPYGWEQGLNLGGIRRMDRPVQERLRALHKKTGRRVSLIGWSLGGIYARRAALGNPGLVRQVITLGTPFTGDTRATYERPIYEAVAGESAAELHQPNPPADTLPVPITAVYSRMDGVVNWRTCLVNTGSRAENVEIRGASHLGMGVHPAVLWLLADRLAQPEGPFQPFVPSGPFAMIYGS
ncbi:MAG TPA: alpha/beta hydrolase, partial [Acidisphaera sp.]|nr:alpha/beta hydrolase [Acidisphaera sp.]